jgi:hypothetical protein
VNTLTKIESEVLERVVCHEVNIRVTPCLAAYKLTHPIAHPIWKEYLLSVVHLRNCERHPDSTHEITVIAIHEGMALSPPNLIYQLRSLTDEQAVKVFDRLAEAFLKNRLSPDSDSHRFQISFLDDLLKSS